MKLLKKKKSLKNMLSRRIPIIIKKKKEKNEYSAIFGWDVL